MKGRSINKNMLFEKEMIKNIIKRGKSTNVVIKVDMAKVYDRVDWNFLKKIGFNNMVVDKVWRFFLIIGTIY